MSKVEPAPTSAASMFAALGDPVRLALVIKLSAGGERSIVTLAAGSGLTRQAVTKHLHVLSEAGLVRACRYGRENRFALVADRLTDASRYLDLVAAQWDDALDRLKAHVED